MATDALPDYATHEDISRLEGHVSRVEGHVQETQKDVRRLEGYVQATREDVTRLAGDVRKTQKDVGRLDGSVVRLEQRMEERLDRIDSRLWMFMGTILVFTLGIVLKEAF